MKLRTIGQCKYCRFWDKEEEKQYKYWIKELGRTPTSFDVITCHKGFLVSLIGNNSCWFWRGK